MSIFQFKFFITAFILGTVVFHSGSLLLAQNEPMHDHEDWGCRMVKAKVAGIKYPPEVLKYAQAAKERSDTFDILHYSIHLEVINFSNGRINGFCEITYVNLKDSLDYINFDLEGLQVSHVMLEGDTIGHTHQGPQLTCLLPTWYSTGDTLTVTVYYGGSPITSPSGFGGFYFENGYAYNLGIGITDQPHNFGRAWYPCFDNFVERSTYEYVITHQSNHQAHCVGTFMGTEDLDNGLKRTTYYMSQQIPTYLSSIAVSTYSFQDIMHQGKYGEVPIRLVAQPQDMDNMLTSFENLTLAIDAFEHWYGPHVWERVGYVITTRGAMEHPTNVAYPRFTIEGGNKNERLMAHELAHMWWGNLMTLSSSHNMWIKEGNAEYGAHLFTEYAYGREAFLNQVKDNSLRVLRRAHIDDGAYLALSPMPENITYSVHTYNKGAMMMHNLRGYLGDDLFSSAMTQLLHQNEYSAIDAYQFRDQLSDLSGYDLHNFFEDWIFLPGYPTFEVDSFFSEMSGNEYDVELFVEQKLKARDKYFNQIPLEISFYDHNYQRYAMDTVLDMRYNQLSVKVPFEPQFVLINESNKLNLGFMGDNREISSTGTLNFPSGLMGLNISQISGEGWLRVEHHFTGADGFKTEQPDARMGKNRHWRVYGELPEGTGHFALISYTGLLDMDDDLVAFTEDSLILIWRPDAHAEWIEHPNYRKFTGSSTDGNGTIRIFNLMAGEYALANGNLNVLSSVADQQPAELNIYPNPVTNELQIGWPDHIYPKGVSITDVSGKSLFHQSITTETNTKQLHIHLPSLIPGIHVLSLEDDQKRIIGTSAIVVK